MAIAVVAAVVLVLAWMSMFVVDRPNRRSSCASASRCAT